MQSLARVLLDNNGLTTAGLPDCLKESELRLQELSLHENGFVSADEDDLISVYERVLLATSTQLCKRGCAKSLRETYGRDFPFRDCDDNALCRDSAVPADNPADLSLCEFGSDCDSCGARSQADLAKYTLARQQSSTQVERNRWLRYVQGDIDMPPELRENQGDMPEAMQNVLTMSETYDTYYSSSDYTKPAPSCTANADQQCPDCYKCQTFRVVETEGEPDETVTEYPCDECEPGLRRITLEQDTDTRTFGTLCGETNSFAGVSDPKACAVINPGTAVGARTFYERCRP
jgi:hypothetical protein